MSDYLFTENEKEFLGEKLLATFVTMNTKNYPHVFGNLRRS